MGEKIDLVRYRNDGDDFHVLWTARRAMRMLDPLTKLVAVAVEGVSENEKLDGKPIEAGLLVIDTVEYYGSEKLDEADSILYSQLKYSTTSPEAHWTLSGLESTLEGFAKRFAAIKREKPTIAESVVRFRFVSNRPIASGITQALSAAAKNSKAEYAARPIEPIYRKLKAITGFDDEELNQFARRLDLEGGQEPRTIQEGNLARETARYTPFLDADISLRLKNLIRTKASSDSIGDNTIRLETLLRQFRLGSESELFPCESKLEKLGQSIPRTQEKQIARSIVDSQWPSIIAAPGGVGKSVLAQRLVAHLSQGSEAVVFDGFAGGNYRNPRLYRHRHSKGLVHIANELAKRGLCDLLVPQQGATEQDYLAAFRNRMEQAAITVSSRSSDAVVLVVIDAADNLGMAAMEAREHSFAQDLLQEECPQGSHIAVLARGHRVSQFLRPSSHCVQIDLDSFDLGESARHLRIRFPTASDHDVEAFHRFTDRNARVQANALAIAKDLPSLINALGPTIETVSTLISGQLSSALQRVKDDQISAPEELERLCTALSALPPPIPLAALAFASELSESAVRSFVYDFAEGRPILISDESVQFRDEPTETWFHEHFQSSSSLAQRIADRLLTVGAGDSYAATVLPVTLYRAGRHDELMRLALIGPEPTTNDAVERREILLQRVHYGLRDALTRHAFSDTTKLLLRAAEEVAATDRQSNLFIENADLVSLLTGSDRVGDFIFRRRAWLVTEKGYVYCALMLATDKRWRAEARRFLSLAMAWLREWGARQRAKKKVNFDPEEVKIESEDIAAFAEVIRSLDGSIAMFTFLRHWRDWAAFDATCIVFSRLIDRGEQHAIDEIVSQVDSRLSIRLAITHELNRACLTPAKKFTRETISLLLASSTRIDSTEYPEDSEVWGAIASVAETAAHQRIAKARVLELLDAYEPEIAKIPHWKDKDGSREITLRLATLRASLRRRKVNLRELVPESLAQAYDDKNKEHDQAIREFKEKYGALLPWYQLRAEAICGYPKDVPAELKLAQERCRVNSYGWGSRYDAANVPNEIGLVWLQIGAWLAIANDSFVAEVERWLMAQGVMIYVPTWTGLARIAALQGTHLTDAVFRLARSSRDLIEGEHSDAGQTASSLVRLARATLNVSREEAAANFERALQHLSRLGDELHERMFALVALAKTAATAAVSNPREAYRLARMGELFHSYNDHKFPWSGLVEAVAGLCPTSAIAIASRWNDRDRLRLAGSLPTIAKELIRARKATATVAAAVHAFGGFWWLRNDVSVFFDSTSSHERKQEVLDTLIADIEFDRTGDESPFSDLSKQAQLNNLHETRLSARINYQAEMPELRSAGSIDLQQPKQEVATDWAKLLAGIDLSTAEGVAKACVIRRSMGAYSESEELLDAMRAAVDPSQRISHVLAVAKCRELYISSVIDGLERCSKDWGASLAIQKALTEAVKEVAVERSEEVIGRGWGVRDFLNRCSVIALMKVEDLLRLLMGALTNHVQSMNSASLFKLAEVFAKVSLTAEEAGAALTFGLDRLEPIMKDDDGDGPWSDALVPPQDIEDAWANLVYVALGSPSADTRWRAAHALRRLCRFGETRVVGALINRLSSDSVPSFTDQGLPFYSRHARLYALIAFARVAKETPCVLFEHLPTFVRCVLEGEPHVLVRHFAKIILLTLESVRTGSLEASVLSAVNKANVSPFQPKGEKHAGRSSSWNPGNSGADDLHFEYDFDRYWLEPLAYAFNVTHADVASRTRRWVRAFGGKKNFSHWDQDVRAKRRIYDEQTHASHGSYPRVDRFSHYLSYHAMFCAAGELLDSQPPSGERGRDGWAEWLEDHTLTRNDGEWLADRRDFEPLEIREWELSPEDWANRKEWNFSIREEDLDSALGLDKDSPGSIHVWGAWEVSDLQRKESINIRSALVSPGTSIALLRAMQTANNSRAYVVPSERNDFEIDIPEFKLCGWIAEKHASLRFDEFDPFAGRTPWPGPAPGRRIRQLMKLRVTKDGRSWTHGRKTVFNTQIWGDRTESRYKSAGNFGERVVADFEFLLSILKRLRSDLLLKVEVERKHGSSDRESDSEIEYAYRGYTRIYVLKEGGTLHTLRGHNRIRTPAS